MHECIGAGVRVCRREFVSRVSACVCECAIEWVIHNLSRKSCGSLEDRHFFRILLWHTKDLKGHYNICRRVRVCCVCVCVKRLKGCDLV